MSNVSTIVNAVRSAKAALKDLVITVPVSKISYVYNPATGRNVPTTSSVNIDIAIMSFDFRDIDGDNVREDDLKGFVFTIDQNIDFDDEVIYDGTVYKVKAVKKHLAGETLVALEIHLRK